MNCPKCKTPLSDDVKICSNCGFNRSSAAPETPSVSLKPIGNFGINSYSSLKKHWIASIIGSFLCIAMFLLTSFSIVEKSIISEKSSYSIAKFLFDDFYIDLGEYNVMVNIYSFVLILFVISSIFMLLPIIFRTNLKTNILTFPQALSTLFFSLNIFVYFKILVEFKKASIADDISLNLNVFGWFYTLINIALIAHQWYLRSKTKVYAKSENSPSSNVVLAKINSKLGINSYASLKMHWTISLLSCLSCIVLFLLSKLSIITQTGAETKETLFPLANFFKGHYNTDLKDFKDGAFVGIIPSYAFILVLFVIASIIMLKPLLSGNPLKQGHLSFVRTISILLLSLDLIVYFKTLFEYGQATSAKTSIQLDFVGWIYILVNIFIITHQFYINSKTKDYSPGYIH